MVPSPDETETTAGGETAGGETAGETAETAGEMAGGQEVSPVVEKTEEAAKAWVGFLFGCGWSLSAERWWRKKCVEKVQEFLCWAA